MRYHLVEHGLSDEAVADLVMLLREHRPEVVEEAVREIEQRLPVFVRPHDPRYAELLSLTVSWTIGQFIDLIEDPADSTEQMLAHCRELGEGTAKEGIGPEAWQAAFRVGAGVAINRLSEVAETRSGVTANVIGQVAQQVFGYLDGITGAMMEGHAAAAARAAGETQERRRRLLDLLIGEDPPLEEIRDLALEVQWRVPNTVAAVALERRGPQYTRRPSVPPDGLLGMHLAEPCLIISDPDGPGRRAAIASGLSDWRAAIGPTVQATGLARSLDWARRALKLAREERIEADGLIVAVEHIPLMIATRDRDMADYLVAERLGPLLALREPQRFRLAETLLACLECSFNANEVAGHLHLHAQTVRYRQRQLVAMFGKTLHAPDRRLELILALRYWMAGARETPVEGD